MFLRIGIIIFVLCLCQGPPGNSGLQGPLGPPGPRGYEVKIAADQRASGHFSCVFTTFVVSPAFSRVLQVLPVSPDQRSVHLPEGRILSLCVIETS